MTIQGNAVAREMELLTDGALGNNIGTCIERTLQTSSEAVSRIGGIYSGDFGGVRTEGQGSKWAVECLLQIMPESPPWLRQ